MFRLRLAFVSLLIATSFAGAAIYECPVTAKIAREGKNTVDPCEENFRIAMVKYKDKDLDGAIDALLQSVYFARNYYAPNSYYWLGLCYMEKKQDAKAIEAFKKHCEQSIGPAAEGHLHLAEIYLRNDRLREAEDEALCALRDYNGPGPKAHNVLGLIKDRKGNLEEAQFQFEEALGEQPWRYTEAWMNYAENMMKQKAWGPAINQLNAMLNNKIVLKGLDYEKLFLDMGLCYLAKGDHQSAIDNWHECLNYNPNNALAHLQLAMLMDVEQHFSAAIKEYREFVRLSDDQAAIARTKDRITALEQKLAPAQAEFTQPMPSPAIEREEHERQKEEEKQKDSLATPINAKDGGF